jgi:RNA polymerase primary sigma factor
MNTLKQWESCAVDIVTMTPHLDAEQIRAGIASAGRGRPSRQEVNRFLYRNTKLFLSQVGPSPRPIWARRHAANLHALSPALAAEPLPSVDLYPWQQHALAAWIAAGHRGVIEAVTGAGKSRLALAATELELRAGGRVAVLVHTRELVRQWRPQLGQVLRRCGMDDKVGVLGGGSTDTLATHRIVVATAHAAAKVNLLPNGAPGLLIVDEVHHYAAATWQRGLQAQFAHRMGLTATNERDDDGVERILDPYFGGKCFGLHYGEALADDCIAPFKVAFVAVDLTSGEAADYKAASRQMRRFRTKLIRGHGLPDQSHGKFLEHAARLAKSGAVGARLAGCYLSAMTQRRGLLASATGKLSRLQALSPAVRQATRTILFTQTRQAATDAVDLLAAVRIQGAVLDAKMSVDARTKVLAGFEDGTHHLIAAPQLLDEGVDVPAADLAIVLAASRSRRQMIQRLGRVLRKKPDGRLARLVIFYVRGTFEDPTRGGHEGFLDVVTGVAVDVRQFDADESDEAITDYLNDFET